MAEMCSLKALCKFAFICAFAVTWASGDVVLRVRVYSCPFVVKCGPLVVNRGDAYGLD